MTDFTIQGLVRQPPTCFSYGRGNILPKTAHDCIVIGSGVDLTNENIELCEGIHGIDPSNAVFIGGNSTVYMTSGDGVWFDVVAKIYEMEEKLNMLLYGPGGPIYKQAQESFEKKRHTEEDTTSLENHD